MAYSQYSTILDVFRDISDPRNARGKRHLWEMILLLIALGILHGEKTPYGMGMWVKSNTARLLALLRPARGCLPSYATLRRALEVIDIEKTKEQLLGIVAGAFAEPSES